MTTAFPDAHLEPQTMVADEESVAFAYTLTGTHRGDFNGVAPETSKPGLVDRVKNALS